jgi:hypothetical protein
MSAAEVSLGWNNDTVPLHTHACFYYSDETTLRSSLGFLKAGLDQPDDLLVIFADSSHFDQFKDWLHEDTERDIDGLVDSGKLAMIGGEPTMDGLISSIGGRLDAGLAKGYKLIRFLGFIAWGEPGWPDDRTLLDFESKVNDVVMAYPSVIICTYGVPTLGGNRLIYGGLQTHPIVWLGNNQVADGTSPPPPTPSRRSRCRRI